MQDHESFRQVLFIHGGGDDGYGSDAELADSLQRHLGSSYKVLYPEMPDDPSPDFGWGRRIASELAAIDGEPIVVGHSLGASMLLKYLSENEVQQRIRGIFLIATPFWEGDEDWVRGLILRQDFPERLPKGVPMFLYHAEDDDEVEISHLAIYTEKLPRATVRKVSAGGHQLGNDLALVASDIKALESL